MVSDNVLEKVLLSTDVLLLSKQIQSGLPAAAILAIRLADENDSDVDEEKLIDSTVRIAAKLTQSTVELARTAMDMACEAEKAAK